MYNIKYYILLLYYIFLKIQKNLFFIIPTKYIIIFVTRITRFLQVEIYLCKSDFIYFYLIFKFELYFTICYIIIVLIHIRCPLY